MIRYVKKVELIDLLKYNGTNPNQNPKNKTNPLTLSLNPNQFTCNPLVNPSFSISSALISSSFWPYMAMKKKHCSCTYFTFVLFDILLLDNNKCFKTFLQMLYIHLCVNLSILHTVYTVLRIYPFDTTLGILAFEDTKY